MQLNKRKFEIFLEVAEKLNKSLGIVPLLYGSLGLYRIIGEFGKANDIDIEVPAKWLTDNWHHLIGLMKKIDFQLQDEHEHEFFREEIVAFGREEEIFNWAKIDKRNLKTTKLNGIKFKELSAKHYLVFYQLMLQDEFRQKTGKTETDQQKVNLIKNYLRSKGKIHKKIKI